MKSSSLITKEMLYRYYFWDRGDRVIGIVKADDEESAAIAVEKWYNKHGVNVRACGIKVEPISFNEDGIMQVVYC